jgi:prolyl oligopeptidase
MMMRSISRWIAGPFAMLAGSLALAASWTYPTADRGSVVEDYFGTKVADPYRWMEDLDSPATRAFVKAEGALTDGYLTAQPVRGKLRERLKALLDYERFGTPFHAGRRYFFTHNSGLQNQSVLFTTTRLDAPPKIALDPNTLSDDGRLAVVGYVPSHSGRLLAYGVSVSGSDWTEWHIRDLDTGHDLPDVLRHTKYYEPVFDQGDQGLYFSAFPAPPPGQELAQQDLGNALYYHRLGMPTTSDRKLFEQPSHPDWQYLPHLSDDGRWLVVAVGEGEVGDKGLENLFLLDLSRGADATPIPVFEGFDAAYVYAGSDRGTLYFVTTRDAPNGRVIAVDPTATPRPTWREVIAQSTDTIGINEPSVSVVNHRLVVRALHDAHSQVTLYRLDGTHPRVVSLPGPGSVRGFEGRPGDRETFYTFTDAITPPTVYRYDVATGKSRLYKAPKVAFDQSAFEEHQVFYESKDGTRIPMLLAYRKGLKLDGQNPVLLYAYGGFAIPTLPTFNAAHIAWLEHGGIYAIANIRGGGEYGEAWHRPAIREHRQVAFDDFIAAGEWLIRNRYTSSAKLAIQGGSNGGLLMGACVTQRPDLYGAVIAQVGVMDMLRFDRFGQGAGWTGEFGSPQDARDFPTLYAYSPVHNVRAGTRYPATLIVTGDHDTRVMPMHSFKFAAAMQAAQAGPAPIFLMIEKSSGHGGGPTVTQAIDQAADIYSFLFDNLGIRGH